MPVNNNYTVVVNVSREDSLKLHGSKAVSQQKTSNCVVILETGKS